MNHTRKLSFFLGLGCKAMKDVILHHPDWTMHSDNTPLRRLECVEAGSIMSDPDIYIEAMPERVTFLKASGNFDSLNLQDTLWKDDEVSMTWWEYIEWSYHDRN